MHKSKRKWILIGLGVLVIAALIGFTITIQPPTPSLERNGTASPAMQAKLVNETPLETALSLASAANTALEQQISTEAIRVADHEVDLAFAMALQQAQEHPPAQKGEIQQINARIRALETRLQQVQDNVTRLTSLASHPGKTDVNATQQQLEIAQARVTLLKDALDDAKEDLIRAGGDPQAQIQQELDEHEVLQHHNTAAPQTKPASFEVEGSLISQYRTWQRLRENQKRLREAEQQANTAAETLTRKHETLEKGLSESVEGDDLGSSANDDTAPAPQAQSQQAATIANLNNLSQKTRMLSQYDKRIQAEKQLADMYGRWDAIVQGQVRVALHAILAFPALDPSGTSLPGCGRRID